MLENNFDSPIDFSNGVYQGSISKKSREGTGIFFWDNGMMYIGSWANDQINGQGLFIFPDGSRYIGSFCNNKLENQGFFQSFSNEIFFFSQWHENNLCDKLLYYDKNKKICKIKYINGGIMLQQECESPLDFRTIIRNIPNNTMKIMRENKNSNILEDLINNLGKNNIRYMKYSSNLEYIGFIAEGKAHGLGAFIENGKLFCLGNFEVFQFFSNNFIYLLIFLWFF